MPIRINGVNKASTVNTVTTTPMSTRHLATNANLYEPQRTDTYEFVVTDIDNILRAGTLGTETNAKIVNAQEVLRISNVSSSLPHFSQSVIAVKRGNNTMKFAGTPTFESGKVSFNNWIGADTISALMAWQNLSYNVRTEKVGLAGDYKKDAYLIEYTPDYQKVRQWILHGCWISSLTEDEFNNEQNEKKKISATIEYDWAEIDMTDAV